MRATSRGGDGRGARCGQFRTPALRGAVPEPASSVCESGRVCVSACTQRESSSTGVSHLVKQAGTRSRKGLASRAPGFFRLPAKLFPKGYSTCSGHHCRNFFISFVFCLYWQEKTIYGFAVNQPTKGLCDLSADCLSVSVARRRQLLFT